MAAQDSSTGEARNPTLIERRGDRELIVTRTFDAPASIVYRAWSESDLFRRWWMPKSVTGVALVACDIDMRTGGKYRLEFSIGGTDTITFYGKYLDVVPNERIVWTNDEGKDGGEEGAITTVTFAEQDGKTLLTFHEAYPSAAALEEALQGSAAGLPEQLDQLDELLGKVAAQSG